MPNTFQQPKFPTIPVPYSDDPTSMLSSILALKRAVEMLTDTDTRSLDGTGSDRFAPHVFVQSDQPTALHGGDLWLCTGSTYTFSIWDGTRWLVLTTLPDVPVPMSAQAVPDGFRKRLG